VVKETKITRGNVIFADSQVDAQARLDLVKMKTQDIARLEKVPNHFYSWMKLFLLVQAFFPDQSEWKLGKPSTNPRPPDGSTN
jgi:hypothetical protein